VREFGAEWQVRIQVGHFDVGVSQSAPICRVSSLTAPQTKVAISGVHLLLPRLAKSHSSQGGETATDLKEVLGGEGLREQASRRVVEEGLTDMEELFRSMAKRGVQSNLSFFAFTATPKHKTLAVFGRNGEPGTSLYDAAASGLDAVMAAQLPKGLR
jgi:hypothetical protein